MSSSTIKFYVVPGIIAVIVVVIVLIIPFGRNKNTGITPSPTAQLLIPTTILPSRTSSIPKGPSPTLIPINEFTGADINQELPPEMKSVGEQKTTLRRQLPLSLEFGKITFDYENDQFLVQLVEPVEQSRNIFTKWLTDNYPALSLDKFAFQ